MKTILTIFFIYYNRSFPQNLTHWLLEKSEMISLQMLIQKNTFNVLSSRCPLKKACSARSALVSLAWTPLAWDSPVKMSQAFHDPSICFNVLFFHWKVNTFETPEMWLHLDSDIWTGCFAISFAGSFHYFKPVSCRILFCENVAGIPRPFEQLPSCVGKVNTLKTPEMHLYFDSDVWGGCLTIIFGGSSLL